MEHEFPQRIRLGRDRGASRDLTLLVIFGL